MTEQRKYALPFGYAVTFRYDRASGLAAEWDPSVPVIRKEKARRKFFEAYKQTRRDFMTEIAAVLGGGVLIVDIDTKFGMKVVTPPSKD
jgi:hypothetical protein